MNEKELCDEITQFAAHLFRRGLAPGSSGNISVKFEEGCLITPTNASLASLEPSRISKLDRRGRRLSGDPPSKEAVLHLAVYEERPSAQAIVHLHSPYCVAVSCLLEVNPEDVLPPITAYYMMRVGRLPLIPYYPPGDLALAEAVRIAARHHNAMLLANHGPVVAGASLATAVYAAEELEETAKIFLLLQGRPTRYLSPEQVAELRARFPIA